MSKKLIAVAAAAALALAGFTGGAANASTTVELDSVDFGGGDATTATKAATLTVPYLNALVASGTETAGYVDITSSAGASITLSTTGGVRVIRDITGLGSASKNWDVSKLGVSSLSYAYTTDSASDFYAYTTSTEAGTLTVNVKTSTTTVNKTFYIKGLAGQPYIFRNVKGIPAVLKDGDEAEITVETYDVFGNKVGDEDDYSENLDLAWGSYYNGDSESFDLDSGNTWEATLESYEDNPFIVSISLDVSRVDGFAAPTEEAFYVVNAKGSADLQKQVTALQKKVANRVTKKRFNTLAKKWNAAFPSQAVKLKK